MDCLFESVTASASNLNGEMISVSDFTMLGMLNPTRSMNIALMLNCTISSVVRVSLLLSTTSSNSLSSGWTLLFTLLFSVMFVELVSFDILLLCVSFFVWFGSSFYSASSLNSLASLIDLLSCSGSSSCSSVIIPKQKDGSRISIWIGTVQVYH